MRVLVVIALVYGLSPGLGEVVESVVHYAATGHLPHSPGERDLGDQGPEHSCGTTSHSCGCCVSQLLARPAPVGVPARLGAPRQLVAAPEARAMTRAPARPFRPPIA